LQNAWKEKKTRSGNSNNNISFFKRYRKSRDEERFVFVMIQTGTIVRGQITQLFFLLATEF